MAKRKIALYVSLLLTLFLIGCAPSIPLTLTPASTVAERLPATSASPTATAQPTSSPTKTTIPPTPTAGPLATTESLVLRGALIDGTGAPALADALPVIQDGRIVAVGPYADVTIPRGARVIEMPQATLLPGFINAHVHNAYLRENLQMWAQEGVTTVRDLGAPWDGEDYFSDRDALSQDPQNARVVAAGPLVTVPDGYPISGNNFPSLAVTSPEDAREQISRLIDAGAEVIKISIESAAGPILSPEEAAAIVETAHARDIPVTAHVTCAADLQRALDAGVDDIAHITADRVSDATLNQMVAADVGWVLTLEAIGHYSRDSLRRFLASDGMVALGNDGGYLRDLEIGMPLPELLAMQDAGLSSMQVIVAATRNAAAVCRLEDTLGTLEVGKLADVLVVSGDPVQDLHVLEDVLLVIHNGVILRDDRPAAPLP